MKGPGERTKYDFRRVWECPACHHRERTGGDVTHHLCACQRKVEPAARLWMRGRRLDLPKTPLSGEQLPAPDELPSPEQLPPPEQLPAPEVSPPENNDAAASV
jgi:hypothetical protein